ncbi:hypothetical protein MHK_003321 [Candidatus Magnetomorum sp. HK-1]|nr:hypothetical protein MHK_003321 [Candidatus Magnetomorum sp. HK-1]
MSFQIQKIILYSHTGKTRILSFRRNSVNIITGASKTGKSALIDITKYCLGHKVNTISEGVIIEHVSWFALLLICEQNELFIARRNPGPGKKSSEDIYIEDGLNINIPDFNSLKKNTNRNILIERLTKYTGINHNFQTERSKDIPNIEKALYYCFQKQDEITNKQYLIHQQDEHGATKALKDFLPFFLGLINEEKVSKKNELQKLKQKLHKLELQKAKRKNIQQKNLDEAYSMLAEAKSAGLLSKTHEVPKTWAELKKILENTHEETFKLVTQKSGDNQELDQLFDEKKRLNKLIREKKEEISSLQSMKSGTIGFTHEASEQRSRLFSINILPQTKTSNENICPLCSSLLQNPTPGSDAINNNLKKISKQLDGISTDMIQIDKMIAKKESEIAELDIQRKNIIAKAQAIQKADKRLMDIREANEKRMYTLGRISSYLETVERITEEATDRGEVEDLQSRIKHIEADVSDEIFHQNFNSVISLISKQITENAKQLEHEYSDSPIRFDPENFTIVADTVNSPIPLNKMGSADNILILILITHLVFHSRFAKNNIPVPQFIFFDQPTQAFFPPDANEINQKNSDMKSIIQLFKVVAKFVEQNGFQVIITEHADINESWFQDMITEKWWDGKNKLVPLSWIIK